MATFLACYVICRSIAGRAYTSFRPRCYSSLTMEKFDSFADTANPLNDECQDTMRKVVGKLSLHLVYKDTSEDPYFEKAQKWWLSWTDKELEDETKAWLLLTALFFLVCRSPSALDHVATKSSWSATPAVDSNRHWCNRSDAYCSRDLPRVLEVCARTFCLRSPLL